MMIQDNVMQVLIIDNDTKRISSNSEYEPSSVKENLLIIRCMLEHA